MKKKIFAVMLSCVLAAGMTGNVLAASEEEKTFVYGTTGYGEEMGDAGLKFQ